MKNELKTIARSAKRLRLSTYKTAPRQLLAAHKTPQEITNPVQEPPKTAEAALRCLSDFCDTASKAVSEASGLEGDMEPGSDQVPRETPIFIFCDTRPIIKLFFVNVWMIMMDLINVNLININEN